MFYINYECIDGIIYAVIIAHIIMWATKMLMKGILKLVKCAKRKREEAIVKQIKAMMEQNKLK